MISAFQHRQVCNEIKSTISAPVEASSFVNCAKNNLQQSVQAPDIFSLFAPAHLFH